MVVLCMLHFLVSTVTFPLVSMLHFLVSTVTLSLVLYKNSWVIFYCLLLIFQLLHITLDEDTNKGRFGYGSSPAYSESFVRPWSTPVDPTWRAYCYSSSESFFIPPETLWEDLKPVVSYLRPEELNFVHDALKLAYEAHSGQKRRSGEPFIIHPVEVARILGEHVSSNIVNTGDVFSLNFPRV